VTEHEHPHFVKEAKAFARPFGDFSPGEEEVIEKTS